MSAEAGLVTNTLFLSGIWMIVSVAIDKLVPINNRVCAALNCMQDGVNAVGMLLTAWGIICVIIWLGLLINYLVVKNSAATQNQVI